MTLSYRLIISDIDSTLIEQEVIDLLAGFAGFGEEVSAITRRAMAGELGFKEALFERVALLRGLPIEVLRQVAERITFNQGALELREYCRNQNIKFGVVSGGFTQVLEEIPFFQDLDYVAANSLTIANGELLGTIEEPIIDRSAKAEHLRSFADQFEIPLKDCVAIGDGANDLEMLEIAGLSVAFNAKAILRERADLCIEDDLSKLIHSLRD